MPRMGFESSLSVIVVERSGYRTKHGSGCRKGKKAGSVSGCQNEVREQGAGEETGGRF